MRPLCKSCGKNLAAVNCYHNNKIYYRSRCESCIRRGKKLPAKRARWQDAGYKRKPACDRCGFKAKHAAQLMVFHLDGNLNNCDVRNLKTICLNCAVEITKLDLPWRPGDIQPDH